MMRYTVKQAGGDEETTTNTNQNPPDATETMDKKSYLPGQRNPLKDAALGGGIGGLLGTALGYLYGHRGRWLAYDAIAGGAGGAGIGYVVGSSANKDISKMTEPPKGSAEAATLRRERQERIDRANWEDKHKEHLDIEEHGGHANPVKRLVFAIKGYDQDSYENAKKLDADAIKETTRIVKSNFGGPYGILMP